MAFDKSKFNMNRPAANAPAAASAPPAPPRQKWGGFKDRGQAKAPFPKIGDDYVVRVTLLEERMSPKDKATKTYLELETVSGTGSVPVGGKLFILYNTGDDSSAGFAFEYARDRLGAFITAAAGFKDVEELNAFDPQGEFVTALLKREIPALDGRLVHMQVRAGEAMATGGHFNEYAWYVVPEADQDVPNVAAQLAA